jgi:hypothetical protein
LNFELNSPASGKHHAIDDWPIKVNCRIPPKPNLRRKGMDKE